MSRTVSSTKATAKYWRHSSEVADPALLKIAVYSKHRLRPDHLVGWIEDSVEQLSGNPNGGMSMSISLGVSNFDVKDISCSHDPLS